MATLDELKSVKRKYSAGLLQQQGVCGVDIEVKDSGEAALTVHLDTKSKKIRSNLPKELEGYRVNYVYTGPIRKQ